MDLILDIRLSNLMNFLVNLVVQKVKRRGNQDGSEHGRRNFWLNLFLYQSNVNGHETRTKPIRSTSQGNPHEYEHGYTA